MGDSLTVAICTANKVEWDLLLNDVGRAIQAAKGEDRVKIFRTRDMVVWDQGSTYRRLKWVSLGNIRMSGHTFRGQILAGFYCSYGWLDARGIQYRDRVIAEHTMRDLGRWDPESVGLGRRDTAMTILEVLEWLNL